MTLIGMREWQDIKAAPPCADCRLLNNGVRSSGRSKCHSDCLQRPRKHQLQIPVAWGFGWIKCGPMAWCCVDASVLFDVGVSSMSSSLVMWSLP